MYLGLRDCGHDKDNCGPSLHGIVYADHEPPRHSLLGGSFPFDEDMARLFLESFTGRRAYRTPDMLTPEANVVHRALRKTLLPQIGNAESITSLPQWLLLHVMTGRVFDIVDFILCEIQDVILDGLTVARHKPYAHWISLILSRVSKVGEDGHGLAYEDW